MVDLDESITYLKNILGCIMLISLDGLRSESITNIFFIFSIMNNICNKKSTQRIPPPFKYLVLLDSDL